MDNVVFEEKKRTSFLALPLYFTTYKIMEDMINRRKGLLNIVEDDMFMYKVQDVKMKKSFMERIFKLGTVICYTGDVTDHEFVFEHVRNPEAIKEYLMRQSEAERRKRRTMHTMEIDGHSMDMIDELNDDLS